MTHPDPNKNEVIKNGWNDPQQWSGWAYDIYFNKSDPRWWVPRLKPWMGWTVNLAHPTGVLYLYGSCLFLMALGGIIGFFIGYLSAKVI